MKSCFFSQTHPHSWKLIGLVDLISVGGQLFCTEFSDCVSELKKEKHTDNRLSKQVDLCNCYYYIKSPEIWKNFRKMLQIKKHILHY